MTCLLAGRSYYLYAQPNSSMSKKIIVASDGTGDYKSIQGAINSLTDSAADPRVIYIRKGLYNEKVYVEKHNIIFEGEDREGTVITQSIARDEWRCLHNDDWGVATLYIDGNDITLRNLTIINSFGFDWKANRNIKCNTDTANTQFSAYAQPLGQ